MKICREIGQKRTGNVHFHLSFVDINKVANPAIIIRVFIAFLSCLRKMYANK